MECQRCLGDVRFEISAEFRLGLVFNDDQAKALPKRLEPVELDEEGRLDLWDVIEDELLLNLPDFPMHPQDECQALKNRATRRHCRRGKQNDLIRSTSLRSLNRNSD